MKKNVNQNKTGVVFPKLPRTGELLYSRTYDHQNRFVKHTHVMLFEESRPNKKVKFKRMYIVLTFIYNIQLLTIYRALQTCLLRDRVHPLIYVVYI